MRRNMQWSGEEKRRIMGSTAARDALRRLDELGAARLARPAADFVLTLAKDRLDDLRREALVPSLDALLVVDVLEDLEGALGDVAVDVVGGVALETDLGKDVGVGDNGGEGLGEASEPEGLADAELAALAALEDDALAALEDAVRNRRVDGEDEAGLEARPQRRDAALGDDGARSREQRGLLRRLARRALGRVPELLARRDDRDGDGEDLRERAGGGAEAELGTSSERRDLLKRRSTQEAVEVEVRELCGTSVSWSEEHWEE